MNNNCRLNLQDNFILNDIATKNYQVDNEVNTDELIKDMKRVMAFTYDPFMFYIKSKSINGLTIQARNETDVIKIMKNIVVGEEIVNIQTGKSTFKQVRNEISLKTLFDKGVGVNQIKNLFLVRGVRFISDDPQELSLFGGYPYHKIDSINHDLINPFLSHIREVICNNNNDIYNYIINWVSFIVQRPGDKTGSAIIITGDKGTGKGEFFTDVISKLFGLYALPNVQRIEDICGKYNSLIEAKVFVVCNEMQSAENNRYMNADALKSLITERTIVYESKYVNARSGECNANFIFVSNHDLPIKLENHDRRYQVTKASDIHCQDFNYFNKLSDIINHNEFSINLYNYFLCNDISGYHPRNIVMTETKSDMINASKESWELFFEENIDKFIGDGYVSKDCYIDYTEYCKLNGYTSPLSNKTFGLKIKRYVDITQRKRCNVVKRYYSFNNTGLTYYNNYKQLIESMPVDDEVEEYILDE